MLLLTEAGLGCVAQISWTAFHRTVKEVLGAPERLVLYCGLSIGHPDPDDPINAIVADRAEFDEIVTFHR
jgi:nitroreductase